MNMKKELSCKIEKHYAVLSTTKAGWTKELNRVSWNGNPAKLDIREWNRDKTSMSKGITLTDDEASALLVALSAMNE